MVAKIIDPSVHGILVQGETLFPPCTPFGVQKMLAYENIPVEGQNVVVVGASNIVGKPMALMLMQRDATVVICHAKTRDLAQFTILADILVHSTVHSALSVVAPPSGPAAAALRSLHCLSPAHSQAS